MRTTGARVARTRAAATARTPKAGFFEQREADAGAGERRGYEQRSAAPARASRPREQPERGQQQEQVWDFRPQPVRVAGDFRREQEQRRRPVRRGDAAAEVAPQSAQQSGAADEEQRLRDLRDEHMRAERAVQCGEHERLQRRPDRTRHPRAAGEDRERGVVVGLLVPDQRFRAVRIVREPEQRLREDEQRDENESGGAAPRGDVHGDAVIAQGERGAACAPQVRETGLQTGAAMAPIRGGRVKPSAKSISSARRPAAFVQALPRVSARASSPAPNRADALSPTHGRSA
jgi:hypothetical protein